MCVLLTDDTRTLRVDLVSEVFLKRSGLRVAVARTRVRAV